jgi:hypothetical protein
VLIILERIFQQAAAACVVVVVVIIAVPAAGDLVVAATVAEVPMGAGVGERQAKFPRSRTNHETHAIRDHLHTGGRSRRDKFPYLLDPFPFAEYKDNLKNSSCVWET